MSGRGAEGAGGALKSARLLAELAAAARRGVRPEPGEAALAEHVLAELRDASGELAAARFTTDLFKRIQRLVDRRALLHRAPAHVARRLRAARRAPRPAAPRGSALRRAQATLSSRRRASRCAPRTRA
jgi:hypothetical protein